MLWLHLAAGTLTLTPLGLSWTGDHRTVFSKQRIGVGFGTSCLSVVAAAVVWVVTVCLATPPGIAATHAVHGVLRHIA